jgi:putative sugar O-methyltransferase
MTNYLELHEQITYAQREYPSALQTTDFWQHAASELRDVLDADQIKAFRRNSSCLSFFVPTYGFPGNGLTEDQITAMSTLFRDSSLKQKAQINNLIHGYEGAKADHRLILALENSLNLDVFKDFCESDVGQPLEQFTFENRTISRASQNYILGLLFYYLHVGSFNFSNVIEIGGGFGSLGEILAKSTISTKTYINFDIAPTCIFADYYLSQALEYQYSTIADNCWDTEVEIKKLSGFYARPNYEVTKLKGGVDLLVNYHSFQEMEPNVVQAYIEKINEWKCKYLLLRNIREGKQLKTETSAGVVEPIKTNDYLTWLDNYELVQSSAFVFGNITADNFHSELMLLRRIKP